MKLFITFYFRKQRSTWKLLFSVFNLKRSKDFIGTFTTKVELVISIKRLQQIERLYL